MSEPASIPRALAASPAIVSKREIRGREAGRAAAPVAFHGPAADLPKAAELRRRLARPAAAQQLADMGRGIGRRIGAAHRLDHRDAELVPVAHLAQQLDRAAAAIAEGAVMADDDMSQPDRAEHDLLDKG